MLLNRKRKRVQHPQGGPTLTDESQAEAVDVNNIVRQYVRTGLMPQRSGARYEDVSSTDYMAMRNFIADKEALFGGLPARVRARFGGDPYQLLRFIENPANRDEAIKLGLIDAGKTNVQQAKFDLPDPQEGDNDPDEGQDPFEDENVPTEAENRAMAARAASPKAAPKKGAKK